MKINPKATNIELTEEIQDYLVKRLDQLTNILEESEDREIVINADLGKETNHHEHGDIFFIKIRCEYSGEFYYAEAETTDVMSAIDEAKENLIREINNEHEKKQDLDREKGAELKDQMKGYDTD